MTTDFFKRTSRCNRLISCLNIELQTPFKNFNCIHVLCESNWFLFHPLNISVFLIKKSNDNLKIGDKQLRIGRCSDLNVKNDRGETRQIMYLDLRPQS